MTEISEFLAIAKGEYEMFPWEIPSPATGLLKSVSAIELVQRKSDVGFGM